jgi:carboxymethylenebutenolidase
MKYSTLTPQIHNIFLSTYQNSETKAITSNMFQDITKPPPPLPVVEFRQLEKGVTILSPLVRRGTGPPLIILAPNNNDAEKIVEGVPSHMIKWAEEGFTVAEIQQQALGRDAAGALKRSIEAIRENSKCEPKSKIGLVCESPSILLSDRALTMCHLSI